MSLDHLRAALDAAGHSQAILSHPETLASIGCSELPAEDWPVGNPFVASPALLCITHADAVLVVVCFADYGVEANLSRTVLPYGDHLGSERLRQLIASDDGLSPTDAPRAIGADLETLDLRFEQRWRLDLNELASRLRPDTRLVSVTYPHNPTGSTLSLTELVTLVEGHPTATLLVDETYRELAYGEPLPVAATLSPQVVSLSSMSKTFGLPGLRVGWLVCRDERLLETFLAAKGQIFITGAVVDEELTARVLERRAPGLAHVHDKTRSHLSIVRDWITDHELFEWVEPQAGVVCFPRIRPGIDVDVERLYRTLLAEYGTYVGPGWWFDQDPRFFRLGFAWPGQAQLERGLHALEQAASGSRAR